MASVVRRKRISIMTEILRDNLSVEGIKNFIGLIHQQLN